MLSLAPLHPIVVHFTIGLLIAGVLLRWLSLTNRVAFSSPAASALLLAGTAAAYLAVKSGTAAHGPIERIPGVAQAVQDHERWGDRAQDAFLLVAIAEIVLLVMARRGRGRIVAMVSAALCLPAAVCLFEAGEHGGDLVYSYAGGPGLRTGDPADVSRLFIARSEEHTSELQSLRHIVCRLLLEKKKTITYT